MKGDHDFHIQNTFPIYPYFNMPPTRIQMLASIKNGIQTATSRMVPLTRPYPQKAPLISTHRQFTTSTLLSNWLLGKRKLRFKDPTGSPRVPTGGSIRGTTVIWGDYGLRMRDHHRRISAAQLKNGEDVIRRRLRGMAFRLYTRMHAGTAVYKKGNESRMGTGKGKFDHWACRVPVSRLIFELKGDIHEQVIRDAMRLAANKMPGELGNA